MKKFILTIFLILALGAGAAYVFREALIDRLAHYLLSSRLGAPISYDRFKIDAASSEIIIENLKVGNPPGFAEGVFIDASYLRAVIDREALFHRRLHFKKLKIDIRNLSVVKNKDGKLNIDAFRPKSSSQEREAAGTKAPVVDVLSLSVGTVAYKDYSKGDKPSVKVVEVNFKDRSFENVPSSSEIMQIVLGQALKDTAWKTALTYGAATAAGVAILPVGAAVIVTGNDSAQKTVEADLPEVFIAAQSALQELGDGTQHNQQQDRLTANVQGSEVTVLLSGKEDGKIEIVVKARKLLTPQPSTAEAVLFEIIEKIGSVGMAPASVQ
ncbi:MAG TPA: hypothetical protein VD883_00185 [Candidatus Omnitrophota bacterium]|nr:hypothetical protein [Candidatus Omnitrophota bacterium]